MRLDKYLKVSRIIKRRTVANEACDLGRITVNDRVARASYDVKVGDRIAIHFGERTLAVEVLSVADNVGKADAADAGTTLVNADKATDFPAGSAPMYGDTYSLASYEVEVDGLAHDGSDVEANGTSWMLTRYHAGKADEVESDVASTDRFGVVNFAKYEGDGKAVRLGAPVGVRASWLGGGWQGEVLPSREGIWQEPAWVPAREELRAEQKARLHGIPPQEEAGE